MIFATVPGSFASSLTTGDYGIKRPINSATDFCWAIAVIKEHLWEFLERQGFKPGPV